MVYVHTARPKFHNLTLDLFSLPVKAARTASVPLGEYRKQILIETAARNMLVITLLHLFPVIFRYIEMKFKRF